MKIDFSVTVDDLYLDIAQDIMDSIDDDWCSAIVVFNREEDSGEFECSYKVEGSDDDHDFAVTFKSFQAFEELHKITTKYRHEAWNKAVFTIQITGEFTIDFDFKVHRT
jgi:hypothetical protein